MARTFTSFPTDLTGRPLGEPRHEVHRSAQVDLAEVPEGGIAKVMEWVGYDPDRAKAALAAELIRDHDNQRTSLIQRLTARLGEA